MYRASPSHRVRRDEGLIAALEEVVGEGNVRMLGRRGATARLINDNTPAPPRTPPAAGFDVPLEDDSANDD